MSDKEMDRFASGIQLTPVGLFLCHSIFILYKVRYFIGFDSNEIYGLADITAQLAMAYVT